MGKRRPERSERRMQERVARGLVRERERLWTLEPGGSAEHPIDVGSSAVIEVRGRATPCPQCGGSLAVTEEIALSSILRRLELRCVTCGVPRAMHFRVVSPSN